jgi:hypothetical protein
MLMHLSFCTVLFLSKVKKRIQNPFENCFENLEKKKKRKSSLLPPSLFLFRSAWPCTRSWPSCWPTPTQQPPARHHLLVAGGAQLPSLPPCHGPFKLSAQQANSQEPPFPPSLFSCRSWPSFPFLSRVALTGQLSGPPLESPRYTGTCARIMHKYAQNTEMASASKRVSLIIVSSPSICPFQGRDYLNRFKVTLERCTNFPT